MLFVTFYFRSIFWEQINIKTRGGLQINISVCIRDKKIKIQRLRDLRLFQPVSFKYVLLNLRMCHIQFQNNLPKYKSKSKKELLALYK